MAMSDRLADDEQQPLVYQLVDETMRWMAQAPMGAREDVADEVWAFALATFVDGVPITPRGFDESERFGTDNQLMTDGGMPSDGMPQELVVEYTQRFTVNPPEEVDDPVYAEDWFWNIFSEIGYDVVDPRKKDHYEVIDVRERDSDE